MPNFDAIQGVQPYASLHVTKIDIISTGNIYLLSLFDTIKGVHFVPLLYDNEMDITEMH